MKKETLDDYINRTRKHYMVRFYMNLRIVEDTIFAKDKEEVRNCIDRFYPDHGNFVQIKPID